MPSQLFVPTGTMETFVIPPHRPGTLRVWLRGGRGSDAGPTDSTRSTGGRGGAIAATLDLPPGTTLHITAGYGQTDSRQSAGFGPSWVRGGDGGGGGGAASDIRLGGTDLAHRIIVAGGGGGGGGKSGLVQGNSAGRGGVGHAFGYYGGEHSNDMAGLGVPSPPGVRGGGGLHDDGGVGGVGVGSGAPGSPGTLGFGGDGGQSVRLGGGGGGGYYGGGGGGASSTATAAGRGGGGSSWADVTICSDVTGHNNSPPGVASGLGYVLFEWEARRHGRLYGLGRGTRSVH